MKTQERSRTPCLGHSETLWSCVLNYVCLRVSKGPSTKRERPRRQCRSQRGCAAGGTRRPQCSTAREQVQFCLFLLLRLWGATCLPWDYVGKMGLESNMVVASRWRDPHKGSSWEVPFYHTFSSLMPSPWIGWEFGNHRAKAKTWEREIIGTFE